MSRKYIKQIDSKNFVYPNYTLVEYDTEIIHDINNNSITGTIENIVGTFTGSTITISFDYTWNLNNAEPFINPAGDVNILSVHMMAPSQSFYKPFALVEYYSVATGTTTSSASTSITVSPSDVGLTSFTNGNFNFEFRFIGHRSIYPICATVPLVGPSPSPTPTPTPSSTPSVVTPTPTPSPTPGLGYTSGATINVTDPGYIKYTSLTGGTSTYEFISSNGSHVINGGGCVICNTIIPGFPFADVATFTITTCGTSCGGITPTPTPTPSTTPGDSGYYIMIDCQTFETKYSQLLPNGTYNSGDRVEGSYGYYYVISGFTPSYQAITYTITSTGQYGCP